MKKLNKIKLSDINRRSLTKEESSKLKGGCTVYDCQNCESITGPSDPDDYVSTTLYLYSQEGYIG